MRYGIFILLLSLQINSGFSQGFRFEHTGSRAEIIGKEKLKDITRLSQLIPSYAKTIDFVSVQLVSYGQLPPLTAVSGGDTLTQAQRNILLSADAGTDLVFKIGFKYKDPDNGDRGSAQMIKEMQYALTVGPEVEAEFPGGDSAMRSYINKQVMARLTDTIAPRQGLVRMATIAFTINELGTVAEVSIARSSGNSETDALSLDAIQRMPQWKPAENSKGGKIRQKFIITLVNKGKPGC
jgi:TonB family protein